MLTFYTEDILKKYTRTRQGEVKLGQVLTTVTDWASLQNASQKYVLFGIPEDIGVRANHGNSGTSQAWEACLKTLCNIQQNQFTGAENLVVLGEIQCTAEMNEASRLNPKDPQFLHHLGLLVEEIDKKVSSVVEQIISAGKTPIIIGGGHNNSYGNLKGASKALGTPINCINFDAHTDFRPLEHRHSGNGFSYAEKEGYLATYFIFGLHRNYTSQAILNTIKATSKVQFSVFEDIAVSGKKSFAEALSEAETHAAHSNFGLEIDLDSVAYMGSSAMTPSGFSLEECRRFTQYFSTKDTCRYIHICEGAPNRALFSGQIGKALAYVITDIIAP